MNGLFNDTTRNPYSENIDQSKLIEKKPFEYIVHPQGGRNNKGTFRKLPDRFQRSKFKFKTCKTTDE